MLQYLRSDATPLSTENIQDIIKAKNLMKQAPEAMANKYKISIRRVYQIWREVHPPPEPALNCILREGGTDLKKNIIVLQIEDQE
ncbi:26700_t:CDS:1, partial [Gigaspora margarita]